MSLGTQGGREEGARRDHRAGAYLAVSLHVCFPRCWALRFWFGFFFAFLLVHDTDVMRRDRHVYTYTYLHTNTTPIMAELRYEAAASNVRLVSFFPACILSFHTTELIHGSLLDGAVPLHVRTQLQVPPLWLGSIRATQTSGRTLEGFCGSKAASMSVLPRGGSMLCPAEMPSYHRIRSGSIVYRAGRVRGNGYNGVVGALPDLPSFCSAGGLL